MTHTAVCTRVHTNLQLCVCVHKYTLPVVYTVYSSTHTYRHESCTRMPPKSKFRTMCTHNCNKFCINRWLASRAYIFLFFFLYKNLAAVGFYRVDHSPPARPPRGDCMPRCMTRQTQILAVNIKTRLFLKKSKQTPETVYKV